MTYNSVPIYKRYSGDWFEAELPKSAQWEDKVAEWLSGLGWTVTKAPREMRPNAGDWERYSMYYDLTISADEEISKRVEVKHRERLNFTSSDDFPFPDLITYEVARWKRMLDIQPDITIILNRAGTHAVVVDTNTAPFWIKRARWDSRKGRQIEFYFCPVGRIGFFSL